MAAPKKDSAPVEKDEAPIEGSPQGKAPASSQQPAPADEKYEPGHEPGDTASALGPAFEPLPDEAKAKIGDVLKEAATQPADVGIQPHGIANLTQPAPAATDDELKHFPDDVAKKQDEAFNQTAVGQAIAADEDEED